MKKNVIQKSFKREILIYFLLLSILPLLLSNSALVKIFQTMITRQERNEVESQFTSIEAIFEKQMEEFDHITEEIVSEKMIKENLTDLDRWTQNRIYNFLYAKTTDIRDTSTIILFDENGNPRFSTENSDRSITLPVYWGGAKQALNHPGEIVFAREGQGLRAIRAILDEEDVCVGYVMIEMTEEDFEQIFSAVNYGESEIAIMDSHWDSVYSSREAKYHGFAKALRNVKIGSENAFIKTGITCKVNELNDMGMYLAVCRSTSFTPGMMKTMISVIISMTLICFLLCVGLAEYFSNSLSAPINKLSYAMKNVESGNLDIRIDSEREDELGILTRNFNKMTRELKDYMELQVQNQKELDGANIAMMQAQLNPHFLYNTLDTMKWIAKANQVPEIVSLSSDLAKILRTSISGDAFIPLSKELELVDSYVEIQKIRFSDKFQYDVEMSMEFEDLKIPKLIIQPIVENAIIHGIAECEQGSIFVNIFEKEKCLVIEVTDDGKGMDEAIIQALNSRDRNRLKGHIGFYNVDMILCLHYGEEYGLHAENIREGGTKVSIRIPLEGLHD